MRLPVRFAGPLSIFVLSAGFAAAQTPQEHELSGGVGHPAPHPNTRTKATTARTTEAATEEWRVLFISLSLLVMFVLAFVGYLVLEAAHLL